MTNETTETESAQAEAWQQLYQSWLTFMGADTVFEAVNQCNDDWLASCKCTLDPAWQIPLRWLEDMTKVIETRYVPEPMQTLALNVTRTSQTCLEAGQRCTAIWMNTPTTMRFDGQDVFEFWRQSAVTSQQAWQKAVENVLSLNQSLLTDWMNTTSDVVSKAVAVSRDPLDLDTKETEAAEATNSEQMATAGKSRSRRSTKESQLAEGQGASPAAST